MGQRDRRGQPPPDCSNNAQGYEEKRQRRANGNWFCPPGDLSTMIKRPARLGSNAVDAPLSCIKRQVPRVSCVLITNLSRTQQVT
jgi:hypothetical protein